MNNDKLTKVLQRYLKLLVLRSKRNDTSPQGNKNRLRGLISKKQIVEFFIKNGQWPSRKSIYVRERKLAQRLENCVCPSMVQHDPILRRIVLATGRKPSGKRKHNVDIFKEEILDFMKTNNRAPSGKLNEEIIPGERLLRQKLNYYTQVSGDMTLLGKVYDLDPCHRSGIPVKYRPLINSALDVSKPLIRLVK